MQTFAAFSPGQHLETAYCFNWLPVILGVWVSPGPGAGVGSLISMRPKNKTPAFRAEVLMVGTTGIEPVTPSMSTRCSPAELRARLTVSM